MLKIVIWEFIIALTLDKQQISQISVVTREPDVVEYDSWLIELNELSIEQRNMSLDKIMAN